MKQQSFRSRGNNFYKKHKEGNVGIINLQRNREGFGRFTINVGIFSKKLSEFYCSKPVQPALGYLHWETRIGSLIPKQNPYYQEKDKWWSYDDTTDVELLFREVSELITDFAIPAIDSHISDKQLIDEKLATVKKFKVYAETEEDEVHRSQSEIVIARELRDVSILLLNSDEKEIFKTVMSEFYEHTKSYPEFTTLKIDYDRLVKISALYKSENLNVARKRHISEEDVSNSDNKTKKNKTLISSTWYVLRNILPFLR